MHDFGNAAHDSNVVVPGVTGLVTAEMTPATTRSAPRTGALADFWRRLRPSGGQLNLALQGGGAHGAFTWGVLDALLGDPAIRFEGLSGSSAGAMNAVVMADRWMKGGAEGARRGLADFWAAIGRQLPEGFISHGQSDAIDLNSSGKLLATWASYFSPSQLNPFDLNPLRELLRSQIDFDGLRSFSPFKLFIGTTQANSGKLRIFREGELTLDVLLASACLPKIHHAIEIDAEPYWDGGYSANPAVFPLFYDCDSRDVLLVLLTPLRHEGELRSVEEIESRILELAFSANFMREMRMFAHATEFASPSFLTMGRLERRRQKMRFHMIDSSDLVNLRRIETQAFAYGPLLERLRGYGRQRGDAWLALHADAVGRRTTVDIRQWLN